MKPARDKIQHRFADAGKLAGVPRSYSAKDRTVEAVISTGAAVQRPYGTEVLRISRDAIDLTRIGQGGIPLLDHHKQDGINSILGRLTHTWFDQGALVGQFKFNETPEGKKAEGMVARNEIVGISAGYRVDQWEIRNEDGDLVDERAIGWDDDLTFTATRWQLFECSLCSVPADAASSIRSLGSGSSHRISDARARMDARHRMMLRAGLLK